MQHQDYPHALHNIKIAHKHLKEGEERWAYLGGGHIYPVVYELQPIGKGPEMNGHVHERNKLSTI